MQDDSGKYNQQSRQDSASGPLSTSSEELEGIEYPRSHDVLCGRGGHVTSHPGNVQWRMLVDQYKNQYLQANKKGRIKLASELVALWRSQDPPGRFLTRTDPSKGDASLWKDVGDDASIKKALNSLRQQIPTNDFLAAMRKQDGTDLRNVARSQATIQESSSALQLAAGWNTTTESSRMNGCSHVQYLSYDQAREQDTKVQFDTQFLPWQTTNHSFNHLQKQETIHPGKMPAQPPQQQLGSSQTSFKPDNQGAPEQARMMGVKCHAGQTQHDYEHMHPTGLDQCVSGPSNSARSGPLVAEQGFHSSDRFSLKTSLDFATSEPSMAFDLPTAAHLTMTAFTDDDDDDDNDERDGEEDEDSFPSDIFL